MSSHSKNHIPDVSPVITSYSIHYTKLYDLFSAGLYALDHSYVDDVDVISSTAMIETAIKRVPKKECKQVLVVRPCGGSDDRRGYFKSNNYDQSDVGSFSEVYRGEVVA